ncbi:hypothetical protein [Enorma phocaeensis]|uniref:Uncharacterized protein n=1 Tax=Enorma phocaeensis TaxID=1871019 RepID=A0A921IRX9_9ACTN|nr:hypothetical protein [Enorma phocaeensis]HJG36672.1 hypothetical protein [Enorma phocaeensis]
MIAVHCEYCGKEIGSAAFCRYCGKKVTPPPKIEPWKQSVPLSILGVALSALLMFFFQTKGLEGALLLGLWTLFAIIWFAGMLPSRLDDYQSERELAQKEHRDFAPKTKLVSFLNCLFAGIFGLLLNRGFNRNSLGVANKALVCLSIAGVVLTFVVGASIGFLYVAPFEHFAMRVNSTVRQDTNDAGETLYETSRETADIIVFEPYQGEVGFSPDQMGKGYEDFDWIQTDDVSFAGDLTLGEGESRHYGVVASFDDASGYYDAILVAHVQGGFHRVYEIRIFLRGGDVASWRQTLTDVLGDFYPFD